MPSLPDPIVSLLSPFASLFDARTWRKVPILLTGVILAPGRRTVTSALYALGLQEEGDWARYHHVLSRASWSSLEVSRVLLEQLVRHLVPTRPLHLAIDETLERRWGAKIEALGVYRDPVRSFQREVYFAFLQVNVGQQAVFPGGGPFGQQLRA